MKKFQNQSKQVKDSSLGHSKTVNFNCETTTAVVSDHSVVFYKENRKLMPKMNGKGYEVVGSFGENRKITPISFETSYYNSLPPSEKERINKNFVEILNIFRAMPLTKVGQEEF